MRTLAQPPLPPGTRADLFDALHRLHHHAGRPSLRQIAADVGCSHTTISAAFAGPQVPRWGLLELIVETLGGDTGRFKELWVAATESGDDAAETAAPAEVAATVVPRDLPAPPTPFVGRDAACTGLDSALRDAQRGAAAGVVLITGAAGVGKTSLAVAWAHTVAGEHPDGQLYLDLRGYDVSRPRTPSAAVDVVLRRLGVAASAVPRELSEKSALLRSLLAGRRLLLVLDNAYSAEQVWPLLPGSPSCFVVVTSRDTLPGLVARVGVRRLVLDRLDEPTATDLLNRLVGDRARAEPPAVRALAARCAYLPLALRVAAEVVTTDPHDSLADQIARFDHRSARLDLLAAGGDERTAVRSVFSWSVRRLSPAAAALFTLLGLSPSRSLDDEAAAALAGMPTAAAAVAELARAHLVERRGDAFGLHDLLRDYVIELAAQRPEPERHRARQRLFDHYVARCRDPGWLREHRPALVAAARSAAKDSPAHCLRLAALLHSHLEDSGHYAEAISVQRTAIEVARRQHDQRAVAAALCRLAGVQRRAGEFADALTAASEAAEISDHEQDRIGTAAALQALAAVHVRQGRNDLGVGELEQATKILSELGDRDGEAAAANRGGIALMQLGRLHEALAHHRRAYDVYLELGAPLPRGRAANNVGVVCMRLGDYDAAHRALTEALQLARDTGNRVGAGVALANLAELAERRHRWEQAAAGYRAAIAIFEPIGYLGGLADGRRGLGLALARQGSPEDGLVLLAAALELARSIGEADIETATRIDLALVRRLTGRDATADYRAACEAAEASGDTYQHARALDGLARCALDAGDAEQARRLWQPALEVFTRLGVPEAAAAAAGLAEASG
ncbi:tetratricopeptide repeat protein [Actinoplanes sp. NBC_00393]|uniref:ATP-binding protein n=1 Tax=Actinoplanes sp. NBC_00393 TaxID=2975953 RepID=UPI002E215158